METNNKIAELQKQFDVNMEMIFSISKSKILDLVLAEKEKSAIIEKLIDSNLRIYGEILREINTKIGANEQDNKQNEKSETKEKQDNQQDQNKQQTNKDKIKIEILKKIIEVVEYKPPVLKSGRDYLFRYKNKSLADYMREIRQNRYDVMLIRNSLFSGFEIEPLLESIEDILKKHTKDIINLEEAMASFKLHSALQLDSEKNRKTKDITRKLSDQVYGVVKHFTNTTRYNIKSINSINYFNKKMDVQVTNVNDCQTTGIAKCSPEDTFDLEIGFCVAFARAVLGENYNSIIKDVKNNLIIKD